TAAMNPSSGSVPASNIEIRFERGAQLPARAWCAERPRGLVAIVHGLGEHGGRYAALASDLVRARFTVVALDLPGHGEAPGPRGDMASVTAGGGPLGAPPFPAPPRVRRPPLAR